MCTSSNPLVVQAKADLTAACEAIESVLQEIVNVHQLPLPYEREFCTRTAIAMQFKCQKGVVNERGLDLSNRTPRVDIHIQRHEPCFVTYSKSHCLANAQCNSANDAICNHRLCVTKNPAKPYNPQDATYMNAYYEVKMIDNTSIMARRQFFYPSIQNDLNKDELIDDVCFGFNVIIIYDYELRINNNAISNELLNDFKNIQAHKSAKIYTYQSLKEYRIRDIDWSVFGIGVCYDGTGKIV